VPCFGKASSTRPRPLVARVVKSPVLRSVSYGIVTLGHNVSSIEEVDAGINPAFSKAAPKIDYEDEFEDEDD
jgi:hypothetical protein